MKTPSRVVDRVWPTSALEASWDEPPFDLNVWVELFSPKIVVLDHSLFSTFRNPGNGNPGNRIQSLTNPGNGGNRVNRPQKIRRPSGGTPGIATPGMGMDLKQTPGIPTVPGVKPREQETMPL